MYNRPKIKVKATVFEKVLNILSLLLIIASFFFILYTWQELPNKIPIHFDFDGNPNNFGGKGFVFIMPVIALVVFVPVYILSQFPHVHNYPIKITEENAKRIYTISRNYLTLINFETVLLLTIGGFEMVQVGLGKEGLGSWYMPTLLVVIFGTLGLFIYRIVKAK